MIKPGDICRVIESIDGAAVGAIVTVISFQGHHSKLGPIWRCQSKTTLVTEYGGVGSTADFAQSWLQKIDDPDTVLEKDKTLELNT